MMIFMLRSRLTGVREAPSLRGRARQGYEVTIYSGTDCKLCDVVREGELLGRLGRKFTGTEVVRREGKSNEGRSHFG